MAVGEHEVADLTELSAAPAEHGARRIERARVLATRGDLAEDTRRAVGR